MQTIKSYILMLFTLLGSSLTESKAPKVSLQLERFEQIGGDDFVDTSKLRVRKYNRTEFVLNGTFNLLRNIDSSYDIAVQMAYSWLGNNQYNEYPMKLARTAICSLMVDEYVEYQFIWKNCTNMPRVAKGTKEFCPFPKGEYWVKDLNPDAAFVPWVVPTGLWRMTWQILLPGGQLVGQFRFYFRITKEQ